MSHLNENLTLMKLIIAAPFICGLLIAALPSDAEAVVCRRVGQKANCVNSKDVKDNSLTATDQLDEAGADFASGSQSVFPLGTNVIPRSVTITAPTAGQVIVNASGTYYFGDDAALETMTCSITTGTTVDGTHSIQASEATAASGVRHMPFAGTRGFVVAAGSTTFNLVCTGPTTMHVDDTSITAIFVPTAY